MSKCCVRCFSDKFLKQLIRREGDLDTCDFCESKRVFCIDCGTLTQLFEPVLKGYEPTEYGKHFHKEFGPEAIDISETLPTLLDEDWQVFSDRLTHKEKCRLLDEIRNLSWNQKDRLLEVPSDEFWTGKGNSFFHVDEDDLWHEFCQYIKHERRFIPDPKRFITTTPQEWLEDVPSFCRLTLAGRHKLFRARNEVAGPRKPLHPAQMGAPPPEKTKAQRANPSGIPMLYLASDFYTALVEIKRKPDAAPGNEVSVATMVIQKDIHILDLTNIPYLKSAFEYGDNLQQEIRYRAIFRCLSKALSEPVDPEIADIEYVPTQYLAEAIKDAGFDGIKYHSSKGTGWNLVLFDVEAAKASKVRCSKIP